MGTEAILEALSSLDLNKISKEIREERRLYKTQNIGALSDVLIDTSRISPREASRRIYDSATEW